MKKKGLTLTELLVVLATTALLMAILLPTLAKIRYHRNRASCASNLSQIGKAMHFYANDYQDELPRTGGPTSGWGYTPNWQANDRFSAFNLQPDWIGGQASISASLYLLVKYEQLTPKSVICKGDINTTEFIPAKYGVRGKHLSGLWDFGPEPWKHCSYAYHIPYSQYALTSSSLPGMAVAADRTPWIDSPAAKAKDFSRFKPDLPQFGGTTEQAKYGNAIAHQEDGQNVLFIDGHVEFAKRAYCGVEDDNIYTHLPDALGHPQIGEPSVPFTSQPGHRKDSFLVHDPPVLDK
jgi:prepilin-type processing-associated H-X9-DG protein